MRKPTEVRMASEWSVFEAAVVTGGTRRAERIKRELEGVEVKVRRVLLWL